MRGPQVSDLMTWPVVTAGPGTTFKELVSLLAEHGIAAIPVLDERRRPIGVVDEADLLARHGSEGKQKPVFRKRRVWTKAQGLTARELMTRRAPTVAKDEPVAGAARRLVEAKLRRLYVVDGSGRLIGVLARRDVLRSFLRPDEELKEIVEREVLQRSIWADPSTVTVQVDDGVVTLFGRVEHAAVLPSLIRRVERVDGVVDVVSHVSAAVDDEPRPYRPAVMF